MKMNFVNVCKLFCKKYTIRKKLSPKDVYKRQIVQYMSRPQLEKSIERTRKLMQEAAKKLDFIEAAQYRDELLKMEDLLKEKT